MLVCVFGLTAGPEPLSRAAVRTGLRAGVTGAAGGAGASAAGVTGLSGNQFLHTLPQQPRLCGAVEPTDKSRKSDTAYSVFPVMIRFYNCVYYCVQTEHSVWLDMKNPQGR